MVMEEVKGNKYVPRSRQWDVMLTKWPKHAIRKTSLEPKPEPLAVQGVTTRGGAATQPEVEERGSEGEEAALREAELR